MKITINEKEIELKYTFRSMMIYENIMGTSFNPKGISEVIIYFYSTIIASSKEPIVYDDYLDWLDENPNELANFNTWLADVAKVNEKLKKE